MKEDGTPFEFKLDEHEQIEKVIVDGGLNKNFYLETRKESL